MTEIEFPSRMSDSDALLWRLEANPMLRSTMVGYAVLDTTPDRERITASIRKAIATVPRLRQVVQEGPLGLAPPRWAPVEIDLDDHLRFIDAPGDASASTVLGIVAEMAATPFDPAKPMWEFVIVENMEHGHAAIIQKMHHAALDGMGAMKVALSLVDLERDADVDADPEAGWVHAGDELTLAQTLIDAATHQANTAAGRLRGLGESLASAARTPGESMRDALEAARSIARVNSPDPTPLSPLMTGRSLERRMSTLRVPVDSLKAAGRLAGATVNDAFLAAVAGGLRRYHQAYGEEVDELRFTMPINLRADDAPVVAGNQFAAARFAIPVHIEDPIVRMRAVHIRAAAQRAEPGHHFMGAMSSVLRRLPAGPLSTLAGMGAGGVDVMCTNVPGFPFDVYMAGAKMLESYGFGPLTGAAANFALISHVGMANVGIGMDPAAVVDPDLFVGCIAGGFDEVVGASGAPAVEWTGVTV